MSMDRDTIITPREVEGMIADGSAIVIFEDNVLRLDSWIDRHPGGRLAIMHMVGKDATDEIKVYHSAATLRTTAAYRVGKKSPGPWINMTPPIRGGVYRKRDESPAVTIDSESISDSDEDTIDNAVSDISERTSTPLSSECYSEDDTEVKAGEPILKSSIRRRAGTVRAEIVSVEQPPMSKAVYAELLMHREIGEDLQDYPSLDPAVQLDIVQQYRRLHQRVHDEGFYDCPYTEYGKEMIRYVCLFTGFAVTLSFGWYITSALFLGLFWHQIMFTAHDAGHLAITGNFVVDSLIGMFIADFCCGLSIGWWKSSHNIHHLVTNQPEHDPDIQNVPLFATCPSFLKSLHSTYYNFTFVWDSVADFMVPYQRYTYYPIMGIARFNLYLLSWLHVLSTKSSSLGSTKAWWIRPTELAFMSCYWFLFGYCLLGSLPDWPTRIAFVLVSHIFTMPLHVQITLSHWGMSTTDLGEAESFPQRQLRTTMDVDCPKWLDFIHGGLQFQAVHHLFPRVPRHNLRRLQVLVRKFCEDTGIPYTILGFIDGNRKVLGRLEEVSQQVKILLECQNYMAKTGESGLH